MQSSIGGLLGTVVLANSDNTVKVQLGSGESGLFRTGSANLSSSGRALLAQIAPRLNSFNADFNVVGHTDDIPVGGNSRFVDNQALSFARAMSTVQFLRSQGIPTQRLSASGFGSEDPLASNDTAEGRQENRRVDIVLKPR